MANALESLKDRLFDVNALNVAAVIMDWDQQTYMPKQGSDARAEHMSILSRMAHEMFVADDTQRWTESAQPTSEDDEALIRIVKRQLLLKTKLPSRLVEEKMKASVLGHEAWVNARANNDFNAFAPVLEKLFDLSREEAECYGYSDDIYTALLDIYEEGATAGEVRTMFDAIKGPQVELVKAIAAQGPVDDSFLHGEWDTAAQQKLTLHYVKAIGFDLERGRQDTAPHPFCTTFSVNDVRLTTRFKPYLPSSIFGSLHEAGHGLYEQGSPKAWDRTPLAGGVSLGVHESQSRLWENLVGRSRAFWEWGYGDLQNAFPALKDHSLDKFLKAVNRVQPSFIRVEADELTYNLHIIIRFEIESAVLKGELAVKDIPDAWNAKYEEYLGITPKTDSEGCLQDVHWSMGSIGYFPTYTMGNLLSYQIWAAMQADLGDLDALIAVGDFAPILNWLQTKIYRQGSKFPPKELIASVTGKPMGAEDYLAGLGAKYRNLYGI